LCQLCVLLYLHFYSKLRYTKYNLNCYNYGNSRIEVHNFVTYLLCRTKKNTSRHHFISHFEYKIVFYNCSGKK